MELIYLISLLIANAFVHVSALKLPIKRASIVKRAAGASVKSVVLDSTGNGNALGTIGDIRYTTTINVNGVDVLVALDTGSTDLWVIPPGGLGQFNDTGISLSLRYGDGSYGVDGTIGLAPFAFGPYKIGSQAFLNANSSTISEITDLGIYGLMGLGFDNPMLSPINDKIQSIYGSEQAWAASVLANIFQQNPSQPNTIALELQRTGDLEDTDGGTFNIGDVEQEFSAVLNSPKLNQNPPGAGRWTTLLDGMKVNGKSVNIPQSSTQGVPSGNLVTLLDTGNPSLQLTSDMRDAIFSGISGAAQDPSGTWAVACDTTTIVEFDFGGQSYPVHPLDLTTVTPIQDTAGNNFTVCLGSNVMVAPGDGFDIALGTPFLRNVYSLYDFGNPFASDNKGPTPFMQFLSTTNPQTAAADAIASRKATLSQMGPEISPQDYVKSLKQSGASGSSLDTSTTDPQSKPAVEKYAPIVIGLLVANLVVGLVLVVLGVLGFIRRGAKGAPRRSSSATYAPVKSKDEDHMDTAYHLPYSTH